MYDRYTLFSPKEELESIFSVKCPEGLQPNFNAAPSQKLPVITHQRPGEIQFFHWGLISQMANNKAISPKLFNLPLDHALNRPMYKRALQGNRCVILANGFYVWKQLTKKQKVPYFCYFSARQAFAIAGVWEEYDDMEGKATHTFNMLLIPATAELRDYQEAMPALLTPEQARQWLATDLETDEAQTILAAVSTKKLQLHAVSPRVNDLKNNDSSLIEPAPPSDQYGNYTLFN